MGENVEKLLHYNVFVKLLEKFKLLCSLDQIINYFDVSFFVDNFYRNIN
jgi:hypothetical protein